MGDRRDRYSRLAVLNPDSESGMANLILSFLSGREGAYLDAGSDMGILASLIARAEPERTVIAIEAEPWHSLTRQVWLTNGRIPTLQPLKFHQSNIAYVAIGLNYHSKP